MLGLLLGACFGLLARLWMRLISVAPEFSAVGTGGIIAMAMIGGLGIGLVRGARLAGGRPANRWWALLAVPFLAAPQGLFVYLGGAILGGWALSGRGPKWIRVLAGVLVLLLSFAPLAVMTEYDRSLLAPLQYFWMVGGLLALDVALALAGREVFRPWVAPTPDRVS